MTQAGEKIDSGVTTAFLGVNNLPNVITNTLAKPSPSNNIVTGVVETYEIRVTLTNGIQAIVGKLEIILPKETSLVVNAACSAFVASSPTKMLSCVTLKDAGVGLNKIVVTHSNTLTSYFNTELVI
jgi:hypothetical protein